MNTPMHRFKYTKLTREQITAKLVQAASGPKCMSGFSDVLVGRSLKIVTDDGPVLSYSFRDKNRLVFSENDGVVIPPNNVFPFGFGTTAVDDDVSSCSLGKFYVR